MEALTDVLSALIPPVVVAGAFIYGAVKLVRSEALGGRRNREDQAEGSELIGQSAESPQR